MIPKLSVVIPAYNEERNLRLMIPVLFRTLNKLDISYEVIIINDGSEDKTDKTVESFTKRYRKIKYIKHLRNLGLTQSLKDGFSSSEGELVFLLPGDYESHPDQDLPILMKKIDKGYDMVVGKRINRKGSKTISSKIYNWLIRILFKIRLHDSNWIKIFRGEILTRFRLRSDWHRYLPIFASMYGYKVTEVPVKYYPRKYGKSKYGMKRILIGSLDLIVLKFLFTFKKKPMLLFGTLGFLSFILGVIGGIYLYFLHLTSTIANRPLINLVMLLIILGIQLFALGFIGELLVDLLEK